MENKENSDIRIQKFIADSGLMSRRAAEEAVKRGEIKVNGVRAEIGQKIILGADTVEYKGQAVTLGKNRNVYIMLNKPVGYVTTMSDEKGRPCVADLVADVGVRVYPVGRLDLESEGLLLLTNDGELAKRLTHPRHSVPKYYNVTYNGTLTLRDRKKLSSEMVIDGYKIQPVKNTVVEMKDDKTVLCLELYEGRNRQIRKMSEKCGFELTKLKRVAIGNIRLGSLKLGAWKHLTSAQVNMLKVAVGLDKK